MAVSTNAGLDIYLVGGARSKELKMHQLDAKDQRAMKKAMDQEWAKWEGFNATRAIDPRRVQKYLSQGATARIIDTRW
eukprot:4459092-Alexandrium_andersonii.AAC.1